MANIRKQTKQREIQPIF